MLLTIQNKLVFVFGTVVSLVVLVSLTAYWNAYRLIDANQLVIHTHEVQEELESILSAIKDAETGQRGYLLTGDDRYLAPYRSATASLEQKLLRVERLVADNRRQLADAAQLRLLLVQKLAELDQTIRLRGTRGLPAALEVVRSGAGKESMDRIRILVAGMCAAEKELLDSRFDAVHRGNSTTTSTIIVATLLNLVLLALGYYAITKHLHERQELERQIDRLSGLLTGRDGGEA